MNDIERLAKELYEEYLCKRGTWEDSSRINKPNWLVLSRHVQRKILEARKEGMLMAADVANNYNRSTTHKYMLGDCILGKLNQIDKIRKNKYYLRTLPPRKEE